MLNDTINPILGNQSLAHKFINLYNTALKTLWDKQFNNEDNNGSACQYTTIGQYWSVYNYFISLSNYIKYISNDWATVVAAYNLDEYGKNLSCNNINIQDLYGLFDITTDLSNLYTWIDTNTIEGMLFVKTTGNVTITTTMTSNCIISFNGDESALANGVNTISLSAGMYNFKIRGKIDEISELAIVGTANYLVTEFSLSENCTTLTALDLSDNVLSSKSVDDTLIKINKIATNNNLATGSIDVSGGTSAETMQYNSDASKFAQCNLDNSLSWTINTNNTTTITC